MVTNTVAPDALGGLDRYVRELSVALVGQGCDVTVVTKQTEPGLPRNELGADGLRILRFRLPRRSQPSYVVRYVTEPWLAVLSAVRRIDPDVIHGHFAVQALPLTVSKRPYLYTFHAPAHREVLPERTFRLAPSLHDPTRRLVRAMERFVPQRAAQVITLSAHMQGELLRLSPGVADRATILPGGIDGAIFGPGVPVHDEFAHGSGPLLFTAGRLVPGKGVRELIYAMPEILGSLPGARLAVAGDGMLWDELQQLVQALELERSVRLLGRLESTALAAWYRSADLVVVPSQDPEGFGLTTAEALACGTPATGTPAGATPEMLRRLDERLVTGGTGPADLAERIIALASDSSLLVELGQRARDAVLPELGWPEVARRHIELYEQLGKRR